MTVTAPVYQILCDEPGCGRVQTFLLRETESVFEMISPDEVYVHHGGEILSDGTYRCSTCRKIAPPEPKEITERLARLHAAPSILCLLWDVVERARAYRTLEQDGTPRLWRGKILSDKALELDEALERIGDRK